ncbi:hypothetical protein QZH41_004225 [Actinostola sp. cb2023]|nr:hypothetical protein QZH41_004225 [Actinostola sp. cb2023]
MKNLTAQEDGLVMQMTGLKSAIEFTENVLSKGSNSDVLSMSKQVVDRLCQLSAKPFDREVKDVYQLVLQVDERLISDGIAKLAKVIDEYVPDPGQCETMKRIASTHDEGTADDLGADSTLSSDPGREQSAPESAMPILVNKATQKSLRIQKPERRNKDIQVSADQVDIAVQCNIANLPPLGTIISDESDEENTSDGLYSPSLSDLEDTTPKAKSETGTKSKRRFDCKSTVFISWIVRNCVRSFGKANNAHYTL